MEVEVAVLMQPFGAFRVPETVVAKSAWELTWGERAVASFEVDSTATIGSILDWGAAALGITVIDFEGESILPSEEVAGVAFFVDDEEEGRSKGMRVYPTVDDAGVARWDEDIMSVPLGRALAAAEAGLIVGDPRRLYLVPQSSAGAFDGLDWSHALEYLKVAEDVVARIGGVDPRSWTRVVVSQAARLAA